MDKRLRDILGGDVFHGTCETRSKTMSAIRGSGNKTTEQRLKMAFVRARISGWKLQVKNLPGRPDFFFVQQGLAVFVDGCFWHHCPKCGHLPKSRSEYWTEKLAINKRRDARNSRKLAALGIQKLRIWEHELKTPEGIQRTLKRVRQKLCLSK